MRKVLISIFLFLKKYYNKIKRMYLYGKKNKENKKKIKEKNKTNFNITNYNSRSDNNL